MTLNNKRIVKNSIFLLSRTIFLTIVTLYTLREVISILGEKEFGLYNVVFGIVAMFAFINSAMMSATQRFLSISIGRNKTNGVRNTFYCSLLIHLVLAVLVGIFIYLLKDYFLNKVLNINGYLNEAIVVYHFAIISIAISFLQVPFSALITAYEKMQAFAYLAIFEGFSKLAVVYLLIYLNYNKVVLYSFFLMIISFLIFLIHVLYCFCNFNKIVRGGEFEIVESKKMIKGMLNFIGWSLIGNLSIVMRNQGANILLNVFFGLVVNAAFAISLTVMTAIGSLIASVSNAINPQIFKAYAEGNLNKFYTLISSGTRYYIYFLSLIIVPLVFFMEFILNIWMNSYPSHTVLFCQLMLVVVLVDSFSILLTSGIQANGNIKWNQIITGSLLCFPLPIAYFLYKSEFSVNSIFYIFIFVSVVSIFTKLYFIQILTRYNLLNYLYQVFLPSVFVVAINSFLMYSLIKVIGMPTHFFESILFLALFGFLAILLILIFGLNSIEKNKLKVYFSKKFKNHKFY